MIGVQLLMMGLLAEVAVRTYHELQAKPTYVVRRVVRGVNVEMNGEASGFTGDTTAGTVKNSETTNKAKK